MRRFIWQSFVLIFSFTLVYFWQQTPLASYAVPALGFLIFLYLITSARKKNRSQMFLGSAKDIFILNTAIFLLVFSTGSISSPLFFLLYFLGFGIAFVFEPGTVFVFVIASFLIFLPDILAGDVMGNAIKVGSLSLISPLAFFFSKEYQARDEQQAAIETIDEHAKDAAETITQDVEEVLQDPNLKANEVEKLNDILEETEDLRHEKE